LLGGAMAAKDLAGASDLTPDRMEILLKAGAGIGILKRLRDGRYALTRQGAALTGVPGLQDMILHHSAFYKDMSDPIALLKGEGETELAQFWPYVFGAAGAVDEEVTTRYSNLMADTQGMVARDTLGALSLTGVKHLMDVGGGSGAFLIEVAKQYSDMHLTLFDLPAVMSAADQRIARAGLTHRIEQVGGSFRDESLPKGPVAISLIRVLYDHNDDTVVDLLAACHAALPKGGRLLISEPMSGGDTPDPITDVYFAFYTLAMQTGRTRSQVEISQHLKNAGFDQIQSHKTSRPYVTSVISAVRSI